MRPILVLFALAACAGHSPDPTRATPSTPAPEPTSTPPGAVLLVSAYTTGTVFRLDSATGAILGDLGPVPGAQGVGDGPDGALYLAAETDHRVLRWIDGASAPFVWDDPATADDETGGLVAPTSALWGPDGLLYVGGFTSDRVHRYDADGRFVDVLDVTVNGADSGAVFGPDGLLYVPCFDGDELVVIDPADGRVVERITDGMASPRAVHVDADGSRWVSAWKRGALVRFGPDGTRLGDLSTKAPTGFAIGEEGIWVGTDQGGQLRLIDADTGEILRTIAGAALGIEGVTAIRWE